MALALVLIPAAGGLLAFAVPYDALRRALLVVAAVCHAGVVARCWTLGPLSQFHGWLIVDAPGRLFLSIASAIFLMAALYAAGYLPLVKRDTGHGGGEEPETAFTGCLLMFLAAMSLVCVSGHFGLLWVAVEASTLASAPLIYFHRTARSLEATWKYLVMCSVGVALALLGNFFLAVAADFQGAQIPVLLADLIHHAGRLQTSWLKAAFIFFLVGYGAKMGLAPLHNWLPDAHSESPSLVSALLSGALLNCAFLGILRAHAVCEAAGIGAFSRELLAALGLLSMAVAAVFIVGQTDYKRMLAYSSVEHMGVLAFGVGLGGAATAGAMLHAVNHSLSKALMFFVAGNILNVYRTKSTIEVRGVLRALPGSGLLWVVGFLAIAGSPPFGPFISEFTIFRAAIAQGHPVQAVIYLALLSLIFVGMAAIVLRMAQGLPGIAGQRPERRREPAIMLLPPVLLAAAVLLLGVYIPEPLWNVLHGAAIALGGR